MNLSEQSVAIATDCLPKGHPRITEFLSLLAACHQRAGYLDQAMHLLQQCAEILREGLPSTREDFCTTLNNIGQAYVEKGMSAEAISVLEECLAFQYSFLRADHPVIGTAI
jgi:tetratricopeptide (TPR) repeat protein